MNPVWVTSYAGMYKAFHCWFALHMWCVARFSTICTILKTWKTPVEECYKSKILHGVFARFSNCTNSVCVCACACACVFIFFHHEGFFRLQNVQDILEGTDQRSCVVNICWLRYSKFHHRRTENVIFHLQRRKLQPFSYWRENDMI